MKVKIEIDSNEDIEAMVMTFKYKDGKVESIVTNDSDIKEVKPSNNVHEGVNMAKMMEIANG